MPTYLVELEDGRKLQIEADTPPTNQEVQAALGEATPPEKDRPFIDWSDAISSVYDFARGVPTTAKSNYYQIKEGLGNPWKRSENYLAAGKATQEYQKELDAAEAAAVESGDASSVSSAFRAAAPSSGFSVGAMGSALAGGSLLGTIGGRVGAAMGGPAGLAAGEIGGRAVGAFAGSYGAAYRAAGAQFLDDARDEINHIAETKFGRPLTEAEQEEAYQELLPLAQAFGNAEAGPEAIGNLAMGAAGRFVLGLGRETVKRLATSALAKAGAVAGGATVELGGETATQVEQKRIEEQKQALLEGRDPAAVAAAQPDRTVAEYATALEEVGPATLATLFLMGGAGKVASKVLDMSRPAPVSLTEEELRASVDLGYAKAKLDEEKANAAEDTGYQSSRAILKAQRAREGYEKVRQTLAEGDIEEAAKLMQAKIVEQSVLATPEEETAPTETANVEIDGAGTWNSDSGVPLEVAKGIVESKDTKGIQSLIDNGVLTPPQVIPVAEDNPALGEIGDSLAVAKVTEVAPATISALEATLEPAVEEPIVEEPVVEEPVATEEETSPFELDYTNSTTRGHPDYQEATGTIVEVTRAMVPDPGGKPTPISFVKIQPSVGKPVSVKLQGHPPPSFIGRQVTVGGRDLGDYGNGVYIFGNLDGVQKFQFSRSEQPTAPNEEQPSQELLPVESGARKAETPQVQSPVESPEGVEVARNVPPGDIREAGPAAEEVADPFTPVVEQPIAPNEAEIEALVPELFDPALSTGSRSVTPEITEKKNAVARKLESLLGLPSGHLTPMRWNVSKVFKTADGRYLKVGAAADAESLQRLKDQLELAKENPHAVVPDLRVLHSAGIYALTQSDAGIEGADLHKSATREDKQLFELLKEQNPFSAETSNGALRVETDTSLKNMALYVGPDGMVRTRAFDFDGVPEDTSPSDVAAAKEVLAKTPLMPGIPLAEFSPAIQNRLAPAEQPVAEEVADPFTPVADTTGKKDLQVEPDTRTEAGMENTRDATKEEAPRKPLSMMEQAEARFIEKHGISSDAAREKFFKERKLTADKLNKLPFEEQKRLHEEYNTWREALAAQKIPPRAEKPLQSGSRTATTRPSKKGEERSETKALASQGRAVSGSSGKPFEQYSPEEYAAAIRGVDVSKVAAEDYRTSDPYAPSYISTPNAQLRSHIARALGEQKPVSAASVDAFDLTLPEGYVSQGDLYVFSPQTEAAAETQTPAPSRKGAGAAGVVERQPTEGSIPVVESTVVQTPPVSSAEKAPEQMTPEEFAGNELASAKYVEEMGKLDAKGVSPPPREFMLKAATTVAHKEVIAAAIEARKPVSAEAVGAYGIKLPEGYVRQGDLYIFQPTSPAVETPTESLPADEKPMSGDSGTVRSKDTVLASTLSEGESFRIGDNYYTLKSKLSDGRIRAVPVRGPAFDQWSKTPELQSAGVVIPKNRKVAKEEPAGRVSVDPRTDELLGNNDRGEPIYWSDNAKTHYAISGGRVRTAPWVEGLPEKAIDRLHQLYEVPAKAKTPRKKAAPKPVTEQNRAPVQEEEVAVGEAPRPLPPKYKPNVGDLVSGTVNGVPVVGKVTRVSGGGTVTAEYGNGKEFVTSTPVPAAQALATAPKYQYTQEQNTAKAARLGLPTTPGVTENAGEVIRNVLVNVSKDTRLSPLTRAIARALLSVNFDGVRLRIKADGRSGAGLYTHEKGTGEIMVNLRAVARGQVDSIGVFLHEALHHATMEKLFNPAPGIETEAVDAIKKIVDHVKTLAGPDTVFDYELGSPWEFVSALFTRPDFQNYLASVPAPDSPTGIAKFRSALSDLFRRIAELVTGQKVQKGSTMEQAIAATMVLFETPQRTGNGAAGAMADRDAEYMDAVEAGDMETAQRMVDEAAKAAGYSITSWHGSNQPGAGFSYYLAGRGGYRFFANKEYAQTYAGKDGTMRRSFLMTLKPINLRSSSGRKDYSAEQAKGILSSRGVNTSGITFRDSAPMWSQMQSEGVKDALQDAGYDSVAISETDDADVTRMVFDPSQIKSADPVTRDNDGNVIPLSQRFQSTSPDIRYAASTNAPATSKLSPDKARAILTKRFGKAGGKFVVGAFNADGDIEWDAKIGDGNITLNLKYLDTEAKLIAKAEHELAHAVFDDPAVQQEWKAISRTLSPAAREKLAARIKGLGYADAVLDEEMLVQTLEEIRRNTPPAAWQRFVKAVRDALLRLFGMDVSQGDAERAAARIVAAGEAALAQGLDPAVAAFGQSAAESAASRRHAELEAKFNAGTITPEETAEAQALVDQAALEAIPKNYVEFNPNGTTIIDGSEVQLNRWGNSKEVHATGLKAWKPGSGSRLLNLLSGWADRNNLRIIGEARPLTPEEGVRPLSKEQLLRFYRSHGFKIHGGDSVSREPKEVIVQSAIQLQDGKLLLGKPYDDSWSGSLTFNRPSEDEYSHGGIISSNPEARNTGITPGFYTSKGRFLDREEGYKVASGAGQVETGRGGGQLYSEDFWNKKIKSADPFTGVPLDRRFNAGSNAIRYSRVNPDAELNKQTNVQFGSEKQRNIRPAAPQQETANKASAIIGEAIAKDPVNGRMNALLRFDSDTKIPLEVRAIGAAMLAEQVEYLNVLSMRAGNALPEATELADDFVDRAISIVQRLGTELGRGLNIFNALARLTPEGFIRRRMRQHAKGVDEVIRQNFKGDLRGEIERLWKMMQEAGNTPRGEAFAAALKAFMPRRVDRKKNIESLFKSAGFRERMAKGGESLVRDFFQMMAGPRDQAGPLAEFDASIQSALSGMLRKVMESKGLVADSQSVQATDIDKLVRSVSADALRFEKIAAADAAMQEELDKIEDPERRAVLQQAWEEATSKMYTNIASEATLRRAVNAELKETPVEWTALYDSNRGTDAEKRRVVAAVMAKVEALLTDAGDKSVQQNLDMLRSEVAEAFDQVAAIKRAQWLAGREAAESRRRTAERKAAFVEALKVKGISEKALLDLNAKLDLPARPGAERNEVSVLIGDNIKAPVEDFVAKLTALGVDQDTAEALDKVSVKLRAEYAEAARVAALEALKLVPTKLTRQAIERLNSIMAGPMKPHVKGEVATLISDHSKSVVPDFVERMVALGVDRAAAVDLDNILKTSRVDRFLASLLKVAPERNKTAKEKLSKVIRTALEAGNLGAMDSQQFMDLFAKEFGLPPMTKEFKAEIKEMVRGINALPKGPARIDAIQALEEKLALWEGIKTRDVLMSTWYANILSGVSTQAVGLLYNNLNLLLKSAVTMLANPKSAKAFVQGALGEGLRTGLKEAVAALQGRGLYKVSKWGDKAVINGLELLNKQGPKGAAQWAAYLASAGTFTRRVFHLMAAVDALAWNTAREGHAYLAAHRALREELAGTNPTAEEFNRKFVEKLGGDTAQIEADLKEARDQLIAAGATPDLTTIDRMARQMRDDRRTETQGDNRFADRVVVQQEPEGLGRLVSALITAIQQVNIVGAPVGQMLVPFNKIVSNLFEQSLDYTPVGIVRGALGGHLTDVVQINKDGIKFREGSKMFDSTERWERAITGTLATSIGFALYALAASMEDEDDEDVPFMIYAFGPTDKNKRSQMPKGWAPFTIKIGDVYYRYAEAPFGMMFAGIGSALDAIRYEKMDDKTAVDKLTYVMKSAAKGFMTQGVLSSVDTAIDVLMLKASDKKLSDIPVSAMKGAIPGQGLLRDLSTLTDDRKIDGSTMKAALLRDIPFVKSYAGRPELNAFGEPVTFDGLPVVRRFVTGVEKNHVADYLGRNDLYIPGMPPTIEVGSYLPKEMKDRLQRRALEITAMENGMFTPDQNYEFKKRAGELTKRAVERVMQANPPITNDVQRKKVQSVLNKQIEIARKRAMLEAVPIK